MRKSCPTGFDSVVVGVCDAAGVGAIVHAMCVYLCMNTHVYIICACVVDIIYYSRKH